MRLSVSGDNIYISEKLRECISRCVHFALGRFSLLIDRVAIRVRDINGPRGGIDKRCQVIVKLKTTRTNPIAVTDDDESLPVAISHAIEKAGKTVARAVMRKRHKRLKKHRRVQVETIYANDNEGHDGWEKYPGGIIHKNYGVHDHENKNQETA